ncbi:vanadium-dependent haloperoxidase [Deminuibacter soli]|uniref:Phosphatase PAP2 family protein n=1 Tax=Deminuibacter soli TaxID=2291815 RepID=A0A3E1NKL4_9BACT|nr:vanadium-dependent haloperoxidase [Deminuibacter soli]RFM28489.1 phosphatase PAP2 family protein [Deminuibacter soli]
MRKLLLFVGLFTTTLAHTQSWKQQTEQADYVHRAIKKVTDVIVYDIYSPPVASRTYAYICTAAYECLVPGNEGYQSLAGQLHGLQPMPQPLPGRSCSYALAAVQAILTVGKTMVISEEKIDAFKEQLLQEFKNTGIDTASFNYSIAYGQKVAEHIIAWSAKDNYRESRSLPKYPVDENPATWRPTPPAYIKAVEPHWNSIRTFMIDSAAQFKPAPATAFSAKPGSAFYKQVMAVHDAVNNLTAEQSEIANFWDCNPFKMNVRGHVMYATKKISPNGHWINITRQACEKTKTSAIQSAEAYARLSIALADCFISCWDEKYRSRVVRPETYINQYIDTAWLPTLQTPPFPEYTSGHSVVSAAAAVILNQLFGEHFSYTDSTESEFGLLPRSFTSFEQAAKEAAISRFYGGIHYMNSINNGYEEGKNIGLFVAGRLRTRKNGMQTTTGN